jgi:carboxyl-terminal processing protease
MKIVQAGSLAGIGAVLGKTNDLLVINTVYPGSPSEKAGLKAGMVIAAVNGVSTAPMKLADAVKLIRGPKGSGVELTVTGPLSGTPQRVTIVRDIVSIPTASATGRVLDGKIGLLTLPSFAETTPKTVAGILHSFRNDAVRGIVLDLRGNGGGSLSAARDVAGMFVGRKPILWLTRKTGGKQVHPEHATEVSLWKESLVVLVDAYTASAAELVASALQTSERAKVVGQKTYGACSIRSIEMQPDGSARRVVAGTMLTAGGDPIDGIGIKPDVALDANLSKEDALQRAVEVLSKPDDKQPEGSSPAPH